MDSFEKYRNEVENYRMIFDHHTHTVYSHGKGTIADNVRVAAAKGLKSIAITDHGPGHLTYGIDMRKFAQMKAEIEDLRLEFPHMEILLGVEANTVRVAPFVDVNEEEKAQCEILLAGYHYGILSAGCVPNFICEHTGIGKNSASLKEKNTQMILHALYNNKIDVLTHPGDKGPFDINAIAAACAETGTLLEINMKHEHLTVSEIKTAAAHDVKFIIGSDAHVPEAVGEFKGSLARAMEAGLDPARIVNIERK